MHKVKFDYYPKCSKVHNTNWNGDEGLFRILNIGGQQKQDNTFTLIIYIYFILQKEYIWVTWKER